jgi:ADP-heptose:LPS heptosyltransferase
MKILVIRFSSIGDIVLTTPVLRAMKEQLPEVEIHYLTKKKFASLLENNPRIDRLITIEKSINEVLPELKNEQYDLVVDLHKNVRTLALKTKLKRPSKSFDKLNFQKWLLVNTKKNHMPNVNIVERYMETVSSLGVKADGQPCEFYISAENEVNAKDNLNLSSAKFLGVAIGAQFATKCLPIEKTVEILREINTPIVLLGGPEDEAKGNEIVALLPDKEIVNTCGKFNLQQSASIVRQASALLTHDTGLMHIATCFKVPIVSVWGNTVPEFGMYPYYPKNPELFSIHEVKNLSCRPCSKIGFQACPKKHFKCMMEQDLSLIVDRLTSCLESQESSVKNPE